MKKTIFLLAAGLTALTTHAQLINETDVPADVKAGFTKLHPTSKVDKWEKESNNYEAEFHLNKIETSVLFDAKGNLIATETEITVSELPKGISEYFTKNVSGKKIKEASKIIDAKGEITYETEIDEANYLFDAKGNFIKKEVETDSDKD